MENVNLCGVAQLLRGLLKQGRITPKEAQKILSRVAVQIGADIIISL